MRPELIRCPLALLPETRGSRRLIGDREVAAVGAVALPPDRRQPQRQRLRHRRAVRAAQPKYLPADLALSPLCDPDLQRKLDRLQPEPHWRITALIHSG